MQHPKLSPLQRGAVGYAVLCLILLAQPQLIAFLDAPDRYADILGFEVWIALGVPLVCHAVALALLVPMFCGWPMPRWPKPRSRKPLLRLVK